MSIFNSLLAQKRLLLADEYIDISWNPYDVNEIAANVKPSRFEHLRIFPRHQALRLNNPDLEYLFQMKKDHERLTQKRFAYV